MCVCVCVCVCISCLYPFIYQWTFILTIVNKDSPYLPTVNIHILTIVNNTAVYIGVYSFVVWLVFLFSSGKHLYVELLDHIVVNIFHFLRNLPFDFFIAAAPIYVPTNNEWGFPFLQILTNTCLCLFEDRHSNTHEDIAHCGFDLLSQMINGVDHLFICLLAIWMSSWRNVHSDSLPSF